MIEVERIAAGLTKARRWAVLSASEQPYHVSDLVGSGELFRGLMAGGLVDRTRCRPGFGASFWGYYLTPLGLAVRNHLQEQSK